MHRSKRRLEIPPWLAIVIIVGVIIVMVAPATPSLLSEPLPQPKAIQPSLQDAEAEQYMANPRKAMEHLRLIARQTRGDWDRAAPSDRQLMDSFTGGHGRAMLKMLAQGKKGN